MALLTRTRLRINRYCSMADFPYFKMAAVRHLGRNFNFRSGLEAQYASLRHILRRSVNPFRKYGRSSIFKMAAAAILDLFYACWDHPWRVFGGLYDCAKFGCNRRSNFDSMQILIFYTLRLKTPIHAPKIGVLGRFYPQNGEQYERDPHIDVGNKRVAVNP